METPTSLSRQLNARMPAILKKTEDVLAWLDFARVDADDALQLLGNAVEHLQIDPVSNYVFKKTNTGAEVNSLTVNRSSTPSDFP